MSTFTSDFAPFFRNTVGFDGLDRLFETALTMNTDGGYPPYNIEKVSEDADGSAKYRIVLAVAGFSRDRLNITQEGQVLTVTGQEAPSRSDGPVVLHRGIAMRRFTRQFRLADTVRVHGADLNDGLLIIELQKDIPEELKPRKIEIAKNSKSGKEVLLG
jgi:molecular chaperone IbpA